MSLLTDSDHDQPQNDHKKPQQHPKHILNNEKQNVLM